MKSFLSTPFGQALLNAATASVCVLVLGGFSNAEAGAAKPAIGSAMVAAASRVI